MPFNVSLKLINVRQLGSNIRCQEKPFTPKTFKLISIGQLGTIQPANEMKCQIEADVDAGFEMQL